MGAVLIVAALTLTACGSGPEGLGGPGDTPTTPHAGAASGATSAPAATPSESPDSRLANAIASVGDDGAETGVDSDATHTLDAVGVARVHWEPTPTSVRLFSYDLTECMIDGTTIAVAGVGAEDATGAPSTLTMDMVAAELLHERTGTYQGGGHATFTADDSEVVADGRVHSTPAGYNGPSMFTYRVTDTTVELKSAFFIGTGDGGAGAIDITCDA